MKPGDIVYYHPTAWSDWCQVELRRPVVDQDGHPYWSVIPSAETKALWHWDGRPGDFMLEQVSLYTEEEYARWLLIS